MRRLMRSHVEADKATVKAGTYNKRLGTRRDPGKPEISTGHPTPFGLAAALSTQ